MTLDELKLRHSALLSARYSGTRSVSYDGKTVNYGTDAELTAAIGDIERRIAKLECGSVQHHRQADDLWAGFEIPK